MPKLQKCAMHFLQANYNRWCMHVFAKICDTPRLQKDAHNMYTFAISDQDFKTIKIAMYVLFKDGEKIL